MEKKAVFIGFCLSGTRSKLALVLNALEGFDNLFASLNSITAKSLDELIQDKKRKRGRK